MISKLSRHFLGALLTMLTGALLAQPAPTVVAVTPPQNALSVDRQADILIDFDSALDPTSINAASFAVLGRWSGVSSGTITLENNDFRLRFHPSRAFSAGEYVTVSLSKGIRNSGGNNLTRGFAFSFWTASDPASLDLTLAAQVPVRQGGEGWIQTYGAYAGDLNGDGYLDFTVPNERSNDVRVFLNDGYGSYSGFVVYPLPNASRPSTNEGADFNNDGLLDFAVGNSTNNRVNVLMGDGNGGFSSISDYPADNGVRGLSVMDLNGDGFMDIGTANRDGNDVSMLLNTGNGTFAPAVNIEANGNRETACAAADANGDGVLDLFVGALSSNEVILLLGDGNGGLSFSDKVAAGGAGPWMVAVGDVDGDGHVDVVCANSSSDNIAVVRGDGSGHLLPAVNYSSGGSFPLAIDLGDLDGDGDLDMVTSNFGSGGAGSGRWSVYENDGSGIFQNMRLYSAPSAASCAVLHDRNNDGVLDMTGIDEIDDLLLLFENTPTGITRVPHAPITDFRLEQNFPNPFNPTTQIVFAIPAAGEVVLKIFDSRGKLVRQLVDHRLSAGTYQATWDGTDGRGKRVASGNYFYQLSLQGRVATRRMTFLR